VSHGDGAAPTKTGRRDGDRPGRHPQKALIDRADRLGEALGLQVWCEDEAGPYQAIPQPGAAWQPEAEPARQPHEYIRGGTAKLLTFFRPATGELRAKGVTSAPNAVLHPWLTAELTQVLAERAEPQPLPAAHPLRAYWAAWLGRVPDDPLPPLRLILVWDNRSGHKTPALIRWLCAQGVLPLYTPLSGSWLNMAEAVQRIIVRRALSGQHPQSSAELIAWLHANIKPLGIWSMQRVIIFTEYRATQKWLHDLLEREGLAEPDHLLTLYGGMRTEDREEIKAAFQADSRTLKAV